MGLKFSDALRLSWSNIVQHKKRSVAIILTISMLFGIIMAFNFMLQGLRGTILNAALQTNDGKVYLQTGYQNISEINEGDFRPVKDLETAQEMVREEVARYDGRILGTMTLYQHQLGNTRWVVNKELADAVADMDLEKTLEDKIPYIASRSSDDENGTYEVLYRDDKALARIGTYPATELGSPTLPGMNLMNLLLGMVYGSGEAPRLIVDDGTGKVEKYIREMAEAKVKQDGYYESVEQLLEAWPPETYFIAEFDDYDDAVNYYSNSRLDKNLPAKIQIGKKKYELLNMDIFGRIMYLELDFNNLQFMLTAIEVLFIIIAVLIAVFTFAHLIDNDAATVALYRSMGASTGDIYAIYFLYLVELCLLAVLSCVLIAFMIVGMMWLGNAEALAERLKGFYMLKDLPKVNLFGFNNMLFGIAGSIMLVAPLSLLLTMRRFSAKHIAKKLKED